ncbi:hypothetical protein [Devosia sp. DBB001]|nr:hypothetical protein [Devosia sp. DBB001]
MRDDAESVKGGEGAAGMLSGGPRDRASASSSFSPCGRRWRASDG